MNFIFFVGAKIQKLKSEKITFYNHITHHLEICRWFYWNLKWLPQVEFLNICDRKNSNLIYGGEWLGLHAGLLFYKRPT